MLSKQNKKKQYEKKILYDAYFEFLDIVQKKMLGWLYQLLIPKQTKFIVPVLFSVC